MVRGGESRILGKRVRGPARPWPAWPAAAPGPSPLCAGATAVSIGAVASYTRRSLVKENN